MKDERRKSVLRRDLNDLVRDQNGYLSTTKIGTLVGQWLSVNLILQHGSEIIANWDSLTVLFMVLIAPEIFKKMLNMKYGPDSGVTTTTTDTSTQASTRKVTKG